MLTGKDLAEQLSDKELGEVLLLPKNTLRAEGDLFLCGMSKEELSEKLSVHIEFCCDDGGELVSKIFGTNV